MSLAFNETRDHCFDVLENWVSNASNLYLLSVAVEASSHSSGLVSLFAQPYVYAGPGLANVDECASQSDMNNCLAGTRGLFFASYCVPSVCTEDVVTSKEYQEWLHILGDDLPDEESISHSAFLLQDPQNVMQQEGLHLTLAREYLRLQIEINNINDLLRSDSICGVYEPTMSIASWLYVCVLSLLAGLAGWVYIKKNHRNSNMDVVPSSTTSNTSSDIADEEEWDEEHETGNLIDKHNSPSFKHTPRGVELEEGSWLSAFDVQTNFSKLFNTDVHEGRQTVLDGIRVFSIWWIMLGHTVAIPSSLVGYSNPTDFLPPNGDISGWFGQLVFGSRFAVDSFFFLSGFLLVASSKKLIRQQNRPWFLQYLYSWPKVLMWRLIRLFPLYLVTLFFWMFLAPFFSLGAPFTQQWRFLMEPCYKNWMYSILMVQNFLGGPTCGKCFCHSWYLDADVQLFLFPGLFLSYLYLRSPKWAIRAAWGVCSASLCLVVYLSYVRKWSVLSLDGAAVERFDIEGYSKPFVRAQPYVVGMIVSMYHQQETQPTQIRHHRWVLLLSILSMGFVLFITTTGAYMARPCNNYEWPHKDNCGSIKWNPFYTFAYTAFCRIIWSLGLGLFVWVLLHHQDNAIHRILSHRYWIPLSRLTFGIYLIHFMVLYIWQLNLRHQIHFSYMNVVWTFIMTWVWSFAMAVVVACTVELPVHHLVKRLTEKRSTSGTSQKNGETDKYGATTATTTTTEK